MEDIGTLISINGGQLLSFALFLLNQGINWSKDQRSSTKREEDNTIRDYLEWLRRESHEELVLELNNHRDQLLEILCNIDGIDNVLNTILQKIDEDGADLKNRLIQLTQVLQKPVFSPIPLHCRMIRGKALLFREQELERLCNLTSDAIVSGQPGVGKSFLLYHYATEHGARFVISDDDDAVVSALYPNCPPVLILDDAVGRTRVLERLIHHRLVSGMTFRIISVCWTHEEHFLRNIMGPSPVHHVELLSADDMALLVSDEFEARGLRPNNSLIREVRKQADGRPGLAIRLVELLAAAEDIRPLYDGTVHYEILDRAFQDLVKKNACEVLAAFAVGGRGGMKKLDVARQLDRPPREISKILQTLSTGGIVATTSDEIVVTRPGSFRQALLKREYLTGDAYGDLESYKTLYELALSKREALHTLIISVAKGARIDDAWILREVTEHGDTELWQTLAYLSRDWCKRVFAGFQGPIEDIATPLLHYVPEEVIPILLDHMVGDRRLASSTPGCAERRLDDWIAEFPRQNEEVARRMLLFNYTKRWMEAGGDPKTGWQALSKCVSLTYSSHECDPGSGRRFTWSTAVASLEEIYTLIPLWDDFVELVQVYPPTNWNALASSMLGWMYPRTVSDKADDNVTSVTRATIKSFVENLLALESIEREGLLKWAVENDMQEMPMEEVVFLICHPPATYRKPIQLRADEHELYDAAQKLGENWSRCKADEILDTLSAFQKECKKWDISNLNYESVACLALAEMVEEPQTWFEKAFIRQLDAHVFMPFLARMVKEGCNDSDYWILTLLQSEKYATATLGFVLELDAFTKEVCDVAAPLLSQYAQTIEGWLCQKKISPFWMRWLINNAQGELALTVAIQDYHSKERVLLNDDREQWLDLFLRGIAGLAELRDDFFYDVDELVAAIPEVRMPLISEITSNSTYISCADNTPCKRLVTSLSREERLGLFPKLINIVETDFTTILIGDDTALYATLLADDNLSSHHLLPLSGNPSSQQWQEKAILALRKGYGAERIARAVLGTHWSFSGSGADFWQGWANEFATLKKNGDPELAEVATFGIGIFTHSVASAGRREHIESIRGLDSDE